MKESFKHILETSAGISLFWFAVMLYLSFEEEKFFTWISQPGLTVSIIVFVSSLLLLVIFTYWSNLSRWLNKDISSSLKKHK